MFILSYFIVYCACVCACVDVGVWVWVDVGVCGFVVGCVGVYVGGWV